MTLREKIAALPPMPELPRIGIVDGSVHYARLLIALHARNALLCEALRNAYIELNTIHARDGVPYTYSGWKSGVSQEWFTEVVENARAVLAACEVTP